MKISRDFLAGVAIGLLIGGIGIYGIMDKTSGTRSGGKKRDINNEHAVLESSINMMRKIHSDSLMGHVLRQVEWDLVHRPDRTVSEETLDQIAALGYALQPYRQIQGDTMSAQKRSPERGHLLLMLLAKRIDSTSLRKMFEKTSFAHADLSGAYLSGAYLNGIDLMEADLRGAQLQGAFLKKANLTYANAWGAIMTGAQLQGARIQLADLRWANLNEACLDSADLEEANMNSVHMRNASLRGAVLEWTQLNGAWLEGSDMTGANMYTTHLTRAHCQGSNFSEANMTSATLIETHLTKANFSLANLSYSKLTHGDLQGAVVSDKTWLEQLSSWHVTGSEDIQNRYSITETDSAFTLQLK